MEFKKYQHLERFGTTEVENIELGKVHVFPKLDGTNASAWLDDNSQVCAGSRNRQLSLEKDNAGFLKHVLDNENIKEYLTRFPDRRLYGEFLVPHSLKTYRQDAWREFYVFDVAIDKDPGNEYDSSIQYIPYEEYKFDLDQFDIKYIPPIAIIENTNYDQLINQLEKNVFLIEDGKGAGEGIVIKNYAFKNKYGRQTWAKIVTSEFKEKNQKTFGDSIMKGKKLIEEDIAKKYVTQALCEKVYSKIENEDGFNSRSIPQLLNTVYYDVVKEDAWNFVKEHKNPSINFNTLKHFIFSEVKEKIPHCF